MRAVIVSGNEGLLEKGRRELTGIMEFFHILFGSRSHHRTIEHFLFLTQHLAGMAFVEPSPGKLYSDSFFCDWSRFIKLRYQQEERMHWEWFTSFSEIWAARTSVWGKEVICMQINGNWVPERGNYRWRSVTFPEQVQIAEGRAAGSPCPMRCWDGGGCPGLVQAAGHALHRRRPFFSLSPLLFWESSWWRQAHSRRWIWRCPEEQDESLLGHGLCLNQPPSPDNRLLRSFLLGSAHHLAQNPMNQSPWLFILLPSFP